MSTLWSNLPVEQLKAELRQEFFRRRRSFAAIKSRVKAAEKKLQQNLWRLYGHLLKNPHQKILAYRPFLSEPRIDQMLAGATCEIFYPVVFGNILLARRDNSLLCVPLYRMDLIFVPCLLFRRDGIRLGRGGGYYDRSLRFIPRERTVIVAHYWQREESIPAQEHDIPVGAWLTEYEIYPPFGY